MSLSHCYSSSSSWQILEILKRCGLESSFNGKCKIKAFFINFFLGNFFLYTFFWKIGFFFCCYFIILDIFFNFSDFFLEFFSNVIRELLNAMKITTVLKKEAQRGHKGLFCPTGQTNFGLVPEMLYFVFLHSYYLYFHISVNCISVFL